MTTTIDTSLPSRDPKQLQEEFDQQRRKVDVDNFDITVRELLRMLDANELIRAPAYQRRFRWGPDEESALVESVLLGLPVPSIFVATNPNGKWELVDGLQRISTLAHFVAEPKALLQLIDKPEPLRLCGLAERKLRAFEGKLFAELPGPIQITFTRRALRVTALSDKSDLDVRFDMFGWLVCTTNELQEGGSGVAFVPDPEYEWR